jgi:hypothetical protein
MIATSFVRRIFAPGVFMCAAILVGGTQARADDAVPILQKMSTYIGSQSTIQVAYDSDIEVITDNLQKIQFTSSGQVLLSRPDKLRASRTGGYADVELVFDGKKLTSFGKHVGTYAQTEFSGSVDQLIDKMRSDFGIEAPGADLLSSRSFDGLMTGAYEAQHIGRGVVDGVECEHLAFRALDIDWQIWIDAGANPIPRKFVITSKGVAGAPQYTLRIRDWKTNIQPPADAFAFKPARDVKQVAFGSLGNIDEVPPGLPQGEKK